MPAPVPIVIRYGQDPMAIGGLAEAAGSAAYQRSQAQLNYENWLRRREMDNQFMIAALDRRARFDVARMQDDRAAREQQDIVSLAQAGQLRVGSPTMRPSIAAASPLAKAVKEQTPAQKALEAERLESAQLRNEVLKGKMAPAQTVAVPEKGGQTKAEKANVQTMIGRGANEGIEWTQGPNGEWSAGVRASDGELIPMSEPVRGLGVSARVPAQVSQNTAAQLQVLNEAKGQIPDDKWNVLWQAVRSGQTKMPQLIDDIRASIPKAGPKAVEQTVIDSAKRSQFRLDAIENIRDPRMKEAAMRQELQMQDTFTYPINRVQEAWAGAKARNGALIPAAQAGMAAASTAHISSDEEFDALPDGTRYVGPDGIERIK